MALMTPDAVVLELMTMGQESAAYIADLLRSSSPSSPHQELAAEILRCCRRVIAKLTDSRGKKRKAGQHEDVAAAAAAAPGCSPPKKRSRGAEPLRVVTSGTTVDGFIWRKYGKKEINGHRHPRLYHRCAYSHQGCTATRRVQRTHEDAHQPAAYEIAYYGEHACRGAAAAACGGSPPPGVVDFGSNAWTSVDAAAAAAPAASEQQLWSFDGEMSRRGWSSSSASSEAGFEAQTTHEWRNTARLQLEVPAATPSDPVTEFLNGSFDWASVLNDATFGFGGALHHISTLQ
ncbi:hypothetical protein PR202_gb04386 [Eleusine coracana subsp. coracana]|uniref:WRKY domain-containing protein n=1 Tax=Eleusine coracana subsp. coracana TaxID=191504 RepID=A0AAV5E3J2_ELECO|nr:hypothetical protein PR202_gb04386 [Eleusine coracana subsp. coracana]